MARPKQKSGHKGRKFVMLWHDLLDLPDYIRLSDKAKVLLPYILRQYNGKNNGDFCAPLSLMKRYGWTSNDTLPKAIKELIGANLLLLSRQGGRRQCNLYAVTFYQIDECNGKLDIPPTSRPPRPLSLEKIPVPSHGIQKPSIVPPDGSIG